MAFRKVWRRFLQKSAQVRIDWHPPAARTPVQAGSSQPVDTRTTMMQKGQGNHQGCSQGPAVVVSRGGGAINVLGLHPILIIQFGSAHHPAQQPDSSEPVKFCADPLEPTSIAIKTHRSSYPPQARAFNTGFSHTQIYHRRAG